MKSPSPQTSPFQRWGIAAAFSAFLIVLAPMASMGKNSSRSVDNANTRAEIGRGKYLVESVAMCGQCHTPRNSDGSLDRSRWLQGAPVIWMPSQPDPDWAIRAPRIGGTSPAGDADMVKLLTTGIWTTGKPLRPPMMPFRMSDSDARAVVAYLRSVSPSP